MNAWARRRTTRVARATAPTRKGQSYSCRPSGIGLLVLVVAPEPEWPRATFVPPHRGAVQEEVVTHRRLESARRGHIGAVNDAVRELVRAQPRRLGDVSGRVRSGRLRHLLDGWGNLARQERLHLLLGVSEAE